MSETTATFADRSTWPSGPWDDEPDRVDWTDDMTGYPCFVKRGPMGAWCGYVGVPPGHRYHGADYDDVPYGEVHHGLSYSAPCDDRDGESAERICHVPTPGEPEDVWWFGFDCGHYNDVIPGMLSTMERIGGVWGADARYRTVEFARAHTTHLARVLAATPAEP